MIRSAYSAHQFRPAGTHQTDHSQNLSLIRFKGDILKPISGIESFYL